MAKDFHELTFLGQARRLRPLAMQALRRFGLEVHSLRQLTSATNFVYRVDDSSGERHVLRLTSPRSCHLEENIRAEVAWLRAIAAETGIGVAPPIPTLGGELVFRLSSPDFPGEYPCTLFTWLPGRMLANRLTEENTRRHGALMARLHRHGRTFRVPPLCRVREYRSPFPYSDPADPAFEPLVLLTEQGDLITKARRDVFRRAQDRVQAVIDRLRTEDEPSVIHNDLHMWNVLVHRKRLFALDFEDLLTGFPIQDIATSLYYYRYRDGWTSHLAAYRSGYESIRPWPERRPGELETLMAGRALLLANFVAASEDADSRAMAPKYLATVESRVRHIL